MRWQWRPPAKKYRHTNSMIHDWKGFGRQRSWPGRGAIRPLPGPNEKKHKKSSRRIANIPAEIRIDYLKRSVQNYRTVFAEWLTTYHEYTDITYKALCWVFVVVTSPWVVNAHKIINRVTIQKTKVQTSISWLISVSQCLSILKYSGLLWVELSRIPNSKYRAV
jgi:hypothetical protein